MNFGQALEALKDGWKVSRTGWNGKGQYIQLVDAETYTVTYIPTGEKHKIPMRPFFVIQTVQNEMATWVPSVSDCLAEDWQVTE